MGGRHEIHTAAHVPVDCGCLAIAAAPVKKGAGDREAVRAILAEIRRCPSPLPTPAAGIRRYPAPITSDRMAKSESERWARSARASMAAVTLARQPGASTCIFCAAPRQLQADSPARRYAT